MNCNDCGGFLPRGCECSPFGGRASRATVEGEPPQAVPAGQPQPDMAKIENDCLHNAVMLCLPKITQAYRYFRAQGKTEDDFDRCAAKAMCEAVKYAVSLTAREVRDPVWPYVASPPAGTAAAPRKGGQEENRA